MPQILLTARDSDVIKTYVELEMGVGHTGGHGVPMRSATRPGTARR